MESANSNQFLETFHSNKRPFGWYLLGSMVVILFSFFGQIPMFFFLDDTPHSGSNPLGMFSHLDRNLLLSLLLIPYVFAFFGFLWIIRQFHEQNLTNVTTSRSGIDIRRILFGFLLWGVISILIFLVALWLNPSNYQWNFKVQPFLIMLVISCAMIPFQSALEEWLFRGYLMQGFATLTKSRLGALILTSFIFGSLHIFNPEVDKLGYGLMAYYIGTGFFFGIIALMDEGIELSIGIHIANNLITALLVTADWTAFQTESLFKDISEPKLMTELFLFLGVIYPLSLLLLSKKYRWSNWSHKLTSSIYETTSNV